MVAKVHYKHLAPKTFVSFVNAPKTSSGLRFTRHRIADSAEAVEELAGQAALDAHASRSWSTFRVVGRVSVVEDVLDLLRGGLEELHEGKAFFCEEALHG